MSPGLRNALWALCGLMAALMLSPLFRRAVRSAPGDWAITPDAARAIALERARDLGEVPLNADAVVRLRWQGRRTATPDRSGVSGAEASARPGAPSAWFWQVTIIPPGVPIARWLDRVRLAPNGALLGLERHGSGAAARDSIVSAGEDTRQPGRWGRVVVSLLAALLTGAVYRRRLRAGVVSFRRHWRVFVGAFGGGALGAVLAGSANAMRPVLASLTLHEAQLVATLLLLGSVLPMALASAWSYSICRPLRQDRRAEDLDAFEAILDDAWRRPAVARAALRGTCAGLLLVACLLLLVSALRPIGVRALPLVSSARGWASARWFGLAAAASRLSDALYFALFTQLFVMVLGARRIGGWAAMSIAALVGAFALSPFIAVTPFSWAIPVWVGIFGVLLAIFRRYGVLTSLLAYWTAAVTLAVLPFLHAPHPWIQFQALLAMLLVALPLIVSVRALTAQAASGE